MALDPQRWTVKTRDAFQAATTQAAAAGNPYVTPAHLLLALLNQADGIARPLLIAANVDPIRRAQTLSLAEWGQICQVLAERGLL